MNVFISRLNEPQRRRFAALEASRMGHGGRRLVSQITGLSLMTIRRGARELAADLALCPRTQLRASGGGRPTLQTRDPVLEPALEQLLASETAGDPMGQRPMAKRSSLQHLSSRLTEAGHRISRPTLAKLLRQKGYSPKRNARRANARSSPPERNAQFEHIAEKRKDFETAGDPIVKVDTKKKELIGNFKNNGCAWCKKAEPVLVHDWPQEAIGQAVPYGIYDVTANAGFVCVGDCFDTPRFAVDAIVDWWFSTGRRCYGQARRLMILADAGGSNSCRSRVWKAQLQEQVCDACSLEVTVCHYPTGCSQWNPIEHRLFSHISVNWAGVPLRTFETMLSYIAGTVTKAGLKVRAVLKRGGNETGERISDAQMCSLNLKADAVCPMWSYTLRPRNGSRKNSHVVCC